MTSKFYHLLALVILLISCPFTLSAHAFSVPNADGVTIYYNKLSVTKCEVSYFDVASTVASGVYPIILKTETIVEPTEVGHEVPMVICLLTIGDEDPSRYDHNSDGKVDIADVTLIVDYIKTHQNLGIQK